ncbi:AbrB/MazE/SpoVT family DNA-binding domain-containing protein [Nitrosopumilus sp.]|uniref:AbrB/MazE/SpoVT family DNA-binding domain-containing protein n=1 Tax=Nitrosopumilus sp. TaxID=2024843 RepID=UPI0029302E85|nr:AbrB/MazE/SpoVT family DNA-binding domain-containing protein [Nitrosopumilus sp.]
MTEESLRYIKNVWLEGNNTLCLGIPSEIVKKLNLNQDSYLLVELVDDTIIVIKKINPQFSKAEINKITTDNKINEKPVDEKQPIEEEFDNPLKDLKL